MFQTYGFVPAAIGTYEGYGAPKKPSGKIKKVAVTGGLKGSAKKKAAPKVTNKDIAALLEKHKFLRDENEDLAQAFAANDMEAAWKVWKSLAKQRDKFKRKGLAAADGKTFKQVAGRSYLGVMTLGASELGRLAFKKKISAARKKRAKAYFDQSDAAQKLLKFWKSQFVDETKKLKAKKPEELSAAQKKMVTIAVKEAVMLDTVSTEGSMVAETDKPPTKEEAAKEAEAEAAVEAEAPKAAVDAAAKSEDPAAVSAPVATEAEAAAAAEGGEAAADAGAAAAGSQIENAEGEESSGMSNTMKIGLAAAGIGLVALLALRR